MGLFRLLFPDMLRSNIKTDERIHQVQLESYRIGFRILEYGVLLSGLFEGLIRGNSMVWRLLAIWFVARLAMFIHQYRNNAIHEQTLRDSVISFVALLLIVLFFASFLIFFR